MTKDDNEKYYFQEIKNSEQIELALSELVQDKSDIHLWQQGKNNLESYNVKNYIPESHLLVIAPSGHFMSILKGSTLLNQNILFKAAAGKYIYFSSGLLQRNSESKDYEISLNKEGPFYQSQQRSNYRILANQINSIKIEIQGEKWPGIDISASGISIAISKARSEDFAVGKIFSQSKMTFNKMTLTVPKLEVKAHKKLAISKEEEGIQVGMAFRELPKSHEQALARDISNQARYQEIVKSMNSK